MAAKGWRLWAEWKWASSAATWMNIGIVCAVMQGELAAEVCRRASLLESLQVGKPGNDDDGRFRRRVEHWKELALGYLLEIFALLKAIDSISQRYFDGQRPLFPTVVEGFDQVLAFTEKTVGICNEHLAEEIQRLVRLLDERKDEELPSPLTIDLAGLIDNVREAAKEQVTYMVDMAKADALDVLGETRQAFELVDRHV